MMDIDLRLILILIGALIVGFIIWDAARKKKLAAEKAEKYNQEALNELYNERDHGGFDLTGVGLSRIIGDDDNFDIEGESLVATRDDDINYNEETMVATKESSNQETEVIHSSTKQVATDDIDAESYHSERQESKTSSVISEPELIITVSILSRSEDGFVGDKLLHCMLSRGLRFGEMNIFHRHKNTSGEGKIQFSLANAVKPGTFDLDDMSTFQTRGVTLFMMLPGPDEPLKSYKLLLDTAQHLAQELNGQLVDGTRSVLTQQTIQHFNEQIQDFERKSLGKSRSI